MICLNMRVIRSNSWNSIDVDHSRMSHSKIYINALWISHAFCPLSIILLVKWTIVCDFCQCYVLTCFAELHVIHYPLNYYILSEYYHSNACLSTLTIYFIFSVRLINLHNFSPVVLLLLSNMYSNKPWIHLLHLGNFNLTMYHNKSSRAKTDFSTVMPCNWLYDTW